MHHRPVAVPAAIGRFRVESLLGSGGMGEVYKAVDPTLHRTVAVKTVRQDLVGRDALDRLYREAQACARLQHPHIVTVFEAGEADGVVYVAMEYLKGENLASRLERGGLPLTERLRILTDVLEALGHAHGEAVIHRDIKPGNIHLTPDGAVKLLDFGLARITQVETLTSAGAVLGTIQYASPEQLKAEPVDARTDIYSTGVLAYEMLAGRRPFDVSGDSAAAIVLKVLTEVPPPIGPWYEQHCPDLPGIVATAMAKAPDDRYQTAEEMRRAIAACLESSRDAILAADAQVDADAMTFAGAAHELNASDRTPGDRRPSWVAAAVATLAIVAATVLLVGTLAEPGTAPPGPSYTLDRALPAGSMSVAPSALPVAPVKIVDPAPASGSATPANPPSAAAGARQLFYTAAPASPAAGADTLPLGLRYRIVKRTVSGGEEDADPDATFRAGDRVRFAFESNVDGYLYVVQEGSSGRWTMLFPNPEINGGRNTVRRLERYQVPPEGWFEFDDTPGTERAFVFLAREPLDALPGFRAPVTNAETTLSAAVIEQVDRSIRSRDLRWVVERERPPASPGIPAINATYVVDRDAIGRAVAAVIELKHGR